jgi:tRNA(Arg) A34 adenosine deaminase TadA
MFLHSFIKWSDVMSPMLDDEHFMRLALDVCRRGIDAGQSPFGACIVRHGEILALEHNHVRLETDATAHAEVVAIRAACKKTGEIHLPGATIYATTEPCPMCFTAIHWARIERIVYAASIADAKDSGFNELTISNDRMRDMGGATLQIVSGAQVLRDEALRLYDYWRSRGIKPY